MRNLKKTLFTTIVMTGILSACEKDPVAVPQPVVNEGELITTLKITFTDSADVNNTVTAVFSDPDGDGGNPPATFDTIKLMANKTYNAVVTILDESKNPAEDLTPEVEAESKHHIFCYTPAGASITVSRTDSDGTYEVGIKTKWVTGAADTGTVKLVLKHQPDVKNGTCDPGETDIEVIFQTVIL